MAVHLHREIEVLKKKILMVGAIAESSVWDASQALQNRDEKLAQQVIDKDIQLDNMEVEVEEACLKTLALYQPVAIDLRFIVAVLKINNDLERVGDLAVNIAERALFIACHPPVDIGFDYMLMATKVQAMLKQSLDALVRYDVDAARMVCAQDDEVDAMNSRTPSGTHCRSCHQYCRGRYLYDQRRDHPSQDRRIPLICCDVTGRGSLSAK